jgi:ankyrin repeat protein
MFQHPRLKELIDYANLVDTESLTSPLMYASANGYLDCVEYLVDTVGVSVSHANQSGNTALHWASLNGHLEVVNFLILKNSNVFAKNVFGKTPFDEAFVRDKKDCCERIAREECRILKERGDEDEDEMRDDDPPNVRTNIDSIPE